MHWFFPIAIIIAAVMIYTFYKKQFTTAPVPASGGKALTWIIHNYPPYHNAGSEWMAHCLNKYLIEQHGFTIYVFILPKKFLGITYSDPTTTLDGVNIYSTDNTYALEQATKQSIAICTHHNLSTAAREHAREWRKPFIHFLHDSGQVDKMARWENNPYPTYLVANSVWIKDYYKSFNYPTFILYPPVYWKDYDVPKDNRELITLINCNSNKGGLLLPQLAKQLPQYKFAGVIGSYSKQIVNPSHNLQYIPNTPNINEIYAKTKIVLIPSAYESWGRVAIEAMSSGIPVIANPTIGLQESIGNAGIFCYRNDISAWVREIKRLCEDKEHYHRMSAKSIARAKELDPESQMNKFAEWVLSISNSTTNPKMTN
jgi:glycosyltransferase involved in cell wall biosynthesis